MGSNIMLLDSGKRPGMLGRTAIQLKTRWGSTTSWRSTMEVMTTKTAM